MKGPLNQTLSAVGLYDIIDYTFYPWGNGYVNTTKCGSKSGYNKDPSMYCWDNECGGDSPPADCFDGVKVCQHGSSECDGDTLENCVMSAYPDPKDFSPFVYCFEGVHQSRKSAGEACAVESGLSWSKIQAVCNDAAAVAKLDAAAARQTAVTWKAAIPNIGTPWVLVNGAPIPSDDLLQNICDAYTGSKPAGCAGAATAPLRATPGNCPASEPECDYAPGKFECCTPGERCIQGVGCRC